MDEDDCFFFVLVYFGTNFLQSRQWLLERDLIKTDGGQYCAKTKIMEINLQNAFATAPADQKELKNNNNSSTILPVLGCGVPPPPRDDAGCRIESTILHRLACGAASVADSCP